MTFVSSFALCVIGGFQDFGRLNGILSSSDLTDRNGFDNLLSCKKGPKLGRFLGIFENYFPYFES